MDLRGRRPVYALLSLVVLASCTTTTAHHSLKWASPEPEPEPRATGPLTPSEWMARYKCRLAGDDNSTEVLLRADKSALIASKVPWHQRLWFNLMDECNREQHAWRYNYINEMYDSNFTWMVDDATADEHYANLVYLESRVGLADESFYKFDSGDAREDARNQIQVAGARVEDEQCERDLAEMVEQLSELEAELESWRVQGPGRLVEHQVRLTRVLDTFGRHRSGSFVGTRISVGQYDACPAISLIRRGVDLDSRPGVATRTGSLMPMRFCWASLDLEPHLNKYLRTREPLPLQQADSNALAAVCLPASCHSRNLKTGKQLDQVQRLVNSQFSRPSSIYYNTSLPVRSVFCLVDDDAPFGMPTSGKVCLASLAAYVLFCCSVTFIFQLKKGTPQKYPDSEIKNHIEPKQTNTQLTTFELVETREHSGAMEKTTPSPKGRSLESILANFDLAASWRDFTSDERQIKDSARVNLDSLIPVRLYVVLFVIASHALLMHAARADYLGIVAVKTEQSNFIMAALAASITIDCFFVVSGMLITYVTLKKLDALERRELDGSTRNSGQIQMNKISSNSTSVVLMRPLNSPVSHPALLTRRKLTARRLALTWMMLFLNRYLRIVPLFALVWWFRRDVLTYLGSGPFWDFGFNKNTMNGACVRESVLMPFTPLAAFVPMSKQCILAAWSIANDMIVALILPPFIVLLKHRPRRGVQVLLALTVCCALAALYHYAFHAEPDLRWELSEVRNYAMIGLFNILSNVYTLPIYRLPSYFFGALAGYAVYRYDTSSQRRDWPRWIRGPLTWAAIASIVIYTVPTLMVQTARNLLWPYHRLVIAQYVTFHRNLWGAAFAVLFARMVTDWRLTPVLRHFASPGYKPLARISYASLLVHWLLIVAQVGIDTRLPIYSYWSLYTSYAAILLLTVPVSIFVHVLFENPIDKFFKTQIFGFSRK